MTEPRFVFDAEDLESYAVKHHMRELFPLVSIQKFVTAMEWPNVEVELLHSRICRQMGYFKELMDDEKKRPGPMKVVDELIFVGDLAERLRTAVIEMDADATGVLWRAEQPQKGDNPYSAISRVNTQMNDLTGSLSRFEILCREAMNLGMELSEGSRSGNDISKSNFLALPRKDQRIAWLLNALGQDFADLYFETTGQKPGIRNQTDNSSIGWNTGPFVDFLNFVLEPVIKKNVPKDIVQSICSRFKSNGEV